MRTLVLTDSPEFFPKDPSSVVFLSISCLVGKKGFFISEETQKLSYVDYPWKTKESYIEANAYLDALFDRMFPSISDRLNNHYGSNFSSRFWKVATAPYLIHLLGALYDRYLRLRCAEEDQKKWNGLQIHLPKITNLPPPRNLHSFFILLNSHDFNLGLYSIILQKCNFSFKISFKESSSHQQISEIKAFRPSFKDRLVNFLRDFTGNPICGNVFLGNCGLSLKDKLRLSFSAFGKKVNWSIEEQKEYLPLTTVSSFRDCELDFQQNNEFENLVAGLIPKLLPCELLEKVPSQPANKRVDLLIGNDVWHTQKQNFEVARIIEHGGQWISAQHGGVYGHIASFPSGKFEYELSDGFISWGWSQPHIYPCKRILPLPSPKLSLLKQHHQSEVGILYISTMRTVYGHRLDSALVIEDLPEYIENKRLFFQELQRKDSKIEFHIKLYPVDYGTKEKSYLQNSVPKENFLPSSSLASDILPKSRIAVIDHLSTSLLEAFASNTPTVLFWKPSHFWLRDEAEKDFEKLREVGILHDTPENAAQLIHDIYDDVDSWWNEKNRQAVVDQFKKKYALASKDYLKTWKAFLASQS